MERNVSDPLNYYGYTEYNYGLISKFKGEWFARGMGGVPFIKKSELIDDYDIITYEKPDCNEIPLSTEVALANVAISHLNAALDQYLLDTRSYPNSAQGLSALVRAPSDVDTRNYKSGGYISEDLLIDPWGNPYQYEEGNSPTVFSFGADGKRGGKGVNKDIRSDR